MVQVMEVGDLVQVNIMGDYPKMGLIVQTKKTISLVEGWTDNGKWTRGWIPHDRIKKIEAVRQ